MKQADVLAFMKHIAERQITNEPAKVFRFSKVATSRKTQDTDRHRAAKYPGDVSADEEVAEPAPKPKKVRKTRTKKAVAKPDKQAAALQKDMEGLIDLRVPATPEAAITQAPAPAEAALAAAEQIAHFPDGHAQIELQQRPATPPRQIPMLINHGGIPTFGPNDPMPYAFPVPAANVNPYLYGQYQYPFSPGPHMNQHMPQYTIPAYPAGIPPEALGVIDPALIGLHAGPAQLPTPRASVTPHMSPIKLQSDTNSIPDRPAGRVMKPQATLKATAGPSAKAKGKAKQVAVNVPETAEPAQKATRPPRPRPKGKAAQDFQGRTSTAQALAVDSVAVVDAQAGPQVVVGRVDTQCDPVAVEQKPVVTVPPPQQSVRMTADVLAAAEANKLNLPAKRVRTAKVRTT